MAGLPAAAVDDDASDADMETGGAAPELLQFGPDLPPLPPVVTPLAPSDRKRKHQGTPATEASADEALKPQREVKVRKKATARETLLKIRLGKVGARACLLAIGPRTFSCP